jgi:hypothetical protein
MLARQVLLPLEPLYKLCKTLFQKYSLNIFFFFINRTEV